tara:strand:+ start:1493 stop:1783 length:291 start_codon:yes stop_codon:yes gene_type:complete
MAKKEKIVDLKSKPEKINQQQLKDVQDTINALNNAQIEVGVMEIKKHEIMHNVAGLRDTLKKLQADFELEYGTFDIDIQTGVINYPIENGEADKKD